jgi:class 3 adenylate cyclase
MAEARAERRLASILATDVVGYSRLMAGDEEGTLAALKDGHEVKSSAFSGATGCDGVRKSVKFELAAAPFIEKSVGRLRV